MKIDTIKNLLKETKLKDFMSKKVYFVEVSCRFSEIPKKFNTLGIRHLPVVNEKKRLVGLMTERELYKIHSPRKLMDGTWYYDEEMLNDIILEHVMLKNIFTMPAEASMGDALVEMVNHKYGCIPIVNKDGVLEGIVTQYDFLKRAAQIYLE